MRIVSRGAVALIVLLASMVALPGRVFAGWEPADITLVNIKKVCKDGIKFEAAVRDGSGPTGDYHNFAVVTDPAPLDRRPVPAESVVIRARISIPKLKKPKNVDIPDSDPISVSHMGSYDMKFYDNLAVGHEIALNVQDFDIFSSYSTKAVENCSL